MANRRPHVADKSHFTKLVFYTVDVSASGGSTERLGSAAGGRRLIVVVYADMVGYSRLIGMDDGGTLRRLRTMRRALIDPAIREHGGQVAQTAGRCLAGHLRQHRRRRALRCQSTAAGP